MPPLSPLSVLLIASATGLISVTRSLVGAKSGRTRSLAATLAKKDLVTIHGSLSQRLKAGVKVRCVLGGSAIFERVECDGVIVGLQPTHGRYGYQDVSVLISQSDLPANRNSSWRVAAIA